MTEEDFDVIIVGAGLSGLSSAKYLLGKSADLKLLVIEAKDRVGGRTLTLPLKTESGTEKFDHGAQWVSRSQPHIMKLVEEYGIKVHEQSLTGRKFLQVGKDNAVKSYLSDIPTLSLLGLLDLDRMMKKVENLAKEIDQDNPIGHKRGEEFDHTTLETFLNSTMWIAESKEVFRVAVRGLIGVEPADVSMLYFLTYVQAAGCLKYLVEATPYAAQEYTLEGGTQQIAEKMAEELGQSRIKLSEPVTSITHTEGVVVTTSTGNVYKSKKVIVAILPQQIVKIEFSPPIPTAKNELIKRSFMGNYVKVLITYKTAFWKEAGNSGEIVTHGGPCPSDSQCSSGPLCISFDETTVSGVPALVAFMGGTQAIQWRQEDAEKRRLGVLACLAQFFGEKVHEYIDYTEKDWDSDPHIQGAPVSCVSTGGMRYYVEGLRKPYGNVHFAGTETATIWTGYMCGAVQAGHRAAIEILQQLRPHSVSDTDIKHNNTAFKPDK